MLRVNATGRKVNGPCWGFNVEISSSQFVNGDKCRSINNGSSFEKLYLHLKNKILPGKLLLLRYLKKRNEILEKLRVNAFK